MKSKNLLKFLTFCILLGAGSGCTWMAARYFRLPPAEHGVRVLKDVKVPMRDGVTLLADVYLPKSGQPAPAILCRLPYGKRLGGMFPIVGKLFAERGYAFVAQDVRGRYDSGGTFFPFIHEIEDGVDTFAWVKKQDWCDGRIGSWGMSYFGITQWAIAAQTGELKAWVPSITSTDIIDTIYRGGVLTLLTAHSFSDLTRTRKITFSNTLNRIKAVETLPVEEVDDASYADLEYFNQIASPERARKIAARFPIEESHREVSAPGLFVAGWYDMFLGTQLRDFVRLRKEGKGLARQSRLIIGPWVHVGMGGDGSVDIPERWDVMQLPASLAWFDHWIRGMENEVEEWPVVRYFLMGKNEWKNADQWPPEGYGPLVLYLHSEGSANTASGDGTLCPEPPRDEFPEYFEYDPLNPVPTLGGANLLIPYFTNYPTPNLLLGPVDQRPVEDRPDVLVFTTPPLTEPLEVAGPVRVHLFASTSARDTDFSAKLIDVHPDGRAVLLQDGIIRARYREGVKAGEKFIEPWKIYEYVIDLWQTANYFPAGHRVRLEISSSNFPRFARNLNTGGDQALEVIPEVARQRVYHNAFYPSRLEVTAAGFPRGGEAPAGAEEEFDEEEPEPPPLAAPEDSNP